MLTRNPILGHLKMLVGEIDFPTALIDRMSIVRLWIWFGGRIGNLDN
jgi:hypothetical protein